MLPGGGANLRALSIKPRGAVNKRGLIDNTLGTRALSIKSNPANTLGAAKAASTINETTNSNGTHQPQVCFRNEPLPLQRNYRLALNKRLNIRYGTSYPPPPSMVHLTSCQLTPSAMPLPDQNPSSCTPKAARRSRSAGIARDRDLTRRRDYLRRRRGLVRVRVRVRLTLGLGLGLGLGVGLGLGSVTQRAARPA